MDYIQELKEFIQSQESPARFRHTLQTAEVCAELADRFGMSAIDATVAGLWHDIARGWSDHRLLAYTRTHGLGALTYEIQNPKLLHSVVGAHQFSSSQLRYDRDPDQIEQVWLAIRWHTTGHHTMGTMGYVLFIADYIEPGRTHLSDADRRKILQLETLEAMMSAVLQMQSRYFSAQGVDVALGPGRGLYQLLS
jgi:predicted HD superfamily hydrolase involved in NAD metabolism